MFNTIPFLTYVVVANISPGPNAILSLSNASRYPLRKAIRFNLGIAVGVFAVMLLCGIFGLAVLEVFPPIQKILVWVGAAYILWLAFQTLKDEGKEEEAGEKEPGNLFVKGIVLQFVNPNTILYGVTAFTTFILPYYKKPMYLIAFSVFLSWMAFVENGCWTVFGSLFQKIIVRYRRAVKVFLALLLAYCAVSLVI